MVTVRRAVAADQHEHGRMRALLWPDEDPEELESELEEFLADPIQVAVVAERDEGGLAALQEGARQVECAIHGLASERGHIRESVGVVKRQ
jgi:hypothetical protein